MLETVKLKIWLLFISLSVLCLLPACASKADGSPVDSSNIEPETTPTVSAVTTPAITASDKTGEATASVPPLEIKPAVEESGVSEKPEGGGEVITEGAKMPERVDVVYFHRAKRCVTCLCFENRINMVVDTYFTDAIDSNRMTYRVVNLGDEANKELAAEYRAIGSQLFINSVIDGENNIENIMEIWDWNCRGDGEGFDAEIIDIILSRLNGEK